MAKYQKNGKIDFLKFLFAVIVVLHHGTQKVLGLKEGFFIGGSLAVEFFFIVSGYLMMASISRMSELTQPLGIDTGKFMWRKIKGFYPEVALGFLLGFVIEYLLGSRTVQSLWQQSFHNAFLLNMTGIGVLNTHGELWYISSMLICMMILYPLVRKYPHMMTRVVLPLTTLLILGYFCANKTNPRNPLAWNGFTYKANLRAMAELGIGICLFPLAEKLKAMNFSTFGRVLLTVMEWVCYFSVIEYMCVDKASRRDYYYIAVYAVAILLSFSGKGIDTALFRGKFFSFLGKFSFPLYLSHNCWAKNINEILPKGMSGTKRYVLYLAVAFVSAVVVMVLADLCRKLGKKLKKPVQKLLFVAKEQPGA